MSRSKVTFFSFFKSHTAAAAVIGPLLLIALPEISVLSYWLGGEGALLAFAVMAPILVLVIVIAGRLFPLIRSWSTRPSTGLGQFDRTLNKMLRRACRRGKDTLCIIAQLDDHAELTARLGERFAERVMKKCAERMQNVLRSSDILIRLGDAKSGVAIFTPEHLTQETAIQLGQRLQRAVAPVIKLGDARFYPSVSLGYSSASQHPECDGCSLTMAALTALADALRHGPSAIRAYAPGQKPPPASPELLNRAIATALRNDQFVPWFQPQISTDTGQISGVEALARWQHPLHGVLSPAAFLPAMEGSGQIKVLGRAILSESLASVALWQRLGLSIGHVGVNFSSEELRDPALIDTVKWELDRYNLAPQSLSIEILETVIASTPDDEIARNIEALSKLGCLIDLDDFGTGHASISSIRRFSVQRLKIDRSFVTRADTDADQQRMVSAILVMAEQLGLQTVGEGVETAGEHAILAQLGCTDVQGYGIARPMPGADIPGWCREHAAKLDEPALILRNSG